jgi:DNA-binding Lrp family transcriptional regulator
MKKQEQEQHLIELRRAKVMELLSKGHTSQAEIARKLNISEPTCSRDIKSIKEKSKKELETHLSDRLPFEYSRAMTGIDTVLKRASEILDSATDNKTRMEALKLQMELYKSIMSLATDGGIVERAMKMVKIISPLPGEDIPAKSEEDKEQKDGEDTDIITEEEEPPTEPEEDLKEE